MVGYRGRPGPWCARHTEAELELAPPPRVYACRRAAPSTTRGGTPRAPTAAPVPSTWTRTARTSPTPTCGSRPGAERDLHRRGPLPPGQPRSAAQRLPARRRQLLRLRTALDNGRHASSDYTIPTASPAAPPTALRAAVLAGRRRHVGRLGHPGQRVPVLPGVQPRHRGIAATRTSPARSIVFRSTGNGGASFNFPGRPVATRAPTPPATGDVPAGQAADDRRQPRRQPVPRPGLRHLDDVRGRRHRLHLRGLLRATTARRSAAPVLRQHATARCAGNTFGAADAAGQLQREPVLPAVHRPRRHAVRRLATSTTR